ncbi:MAG: sterol desaturase family protein [Methylovulum sp.]|uniref:sterol desaturase family protein n=1 Tax=Methylovulum sp. TaxID=1916980 RepID=UPI0026297F64|nr:sterol desaturase family protein [Methylovulum sp.]MDD2723810.1 sterol desaturase family protein [Methylovulum sp.]MDD5126170.1 sterol desaturase family protein [Methylovulum sp.]
METWLRLTMAAGIFALMIGLETLIPRRKAHIDRQQRWPINLGLAAVNMLLMRVSIGGMAYLAADYAQTLGVGLLNWLDAAPALSMLVTLFWLDLAIYWQHVASHHLPIIWRLHQVHHSDLAIDATTAVRFHPLEILLSMVYKTLCIILIGANPLAVVVFEIILNGAATFNHSNIHIPTQLEQALRWLLITPDLHRIHHSTLPEETNSNYGFSVVFWDKLFKTYRPEPQQAQTTMPIGLPALRLATELSFVRLLQLPFKALR